MLKLAEADADCTVGFAERKTECRKDVTALLSVREHAEPLET